MGVLRTAAGCELSELGDFGSGDIILLRENGACANGWSNDEVTDVGSAGMVHGPWGNDATDVSLEVTIPDGLTKCEGSWRSWAIDSRDNEVDRLLIDGEEVWSAHARCWGGDRGDGWELGPMDFPNPYGGERQNEVCFSANTVEVDCSGTMVLNSARMWWLLPLRTALALSESMMASIHVLLFSLSSSLSPRPSAPVHP